MMKRLLLFVVVMFVASVAAAQDVEFTADRPGASTGPTVVGHRVVQLEQGIQYDNDGSYGEFTFSNTLLRYGLFNGVELRLGGDGILYDRNRGESCVALPAAAFSGLSVGSKIRCFEGRGGIPAISLLVDLAIPHTGSEGFATEHLAPSLHVLFENDVTDWFSVGYDVGVEWNGSTPMPEAFVALCLGFAPTERLGCFVESYNYFTSDSDVYGIDFGLSYMVAERVQLDLAADINVCNPKQWALSFGVAWQINNPLR